MTISRRTPFLLYMHTVRMHIRGLSAPFGTVWLVIYGLVFAVITALFGGIFSLAQAMLPLFCAFLLILTPQTPAFPTKVVVALFAPLILVMLWVVIQILPIPGLANSYWRLTEGGSGTLSLHPTQTLHYLIYSLGYLAFGYSTFRAAMVVPGRIVAVNAVVILLACLYGLWVYASGNAQVLWLPKTSYTENLTGPFINKNAFATLVGLGILACLAMALQRVGEISSRLTLRQRFKAFWLLVLVPGWPWLLAALVGFVALVLTGSRAGLLAGLCGIALLLGVLGAARTPVRWPLAATVTLLGVALLIVLGAVGQTVGQRLTSLERDISTRDSIYSLTHQLIGNNLTTGTGLGTYQQAFSTVRDAELLRILPATVEYAHHTYLELATELGLPGILLLGFAAMVVLAVLGQGLITRRRAVIWPALGLASAVLVGGHALADFSLSVPAVTLVAISFVLLGVAQAYPLGQGASPLQTGRYRLLLAALALPLALVSGWLSLAERQAYQAQPTLLAMQSGQPLRVSQIVPAQKAFQACLRIHPGHTGCQQGLAQSYLSLANTYGFRGDYKGVAHVYLHMAKAEYAKLLRHNPVHTWAWYRLARIEAFLGDPATASNHLANSLLTGPYEPKLAILRIPLMLNLLPVASPENAALFGINATAVWQAQKRRTEAIVRKNPTTWPTFAAMVQAQQAALPRWLKLP